MTTIDPEVLNNFRKAFNNLQPVLTVRANNLTVRNQNRTYRIPLTPATQRGFGYCK